MYDFKLLMHLRISLKNPKSLTLDELRSKTREFKDTHNQVAERIWSLGVQISKTTGDAQNQLRKERDELKKLLDECKSQQAITDLLRVLEDKEKDECGESLISECSPYAL